MKFKVRTVQEIVRNDKGFPRLSLDCGHIIYPKYTHGVNGRIMTSYIGGKVHCTKCAKTV